MQYMDKLPDVEAAAGSVLLALGDGNWTMGDGKRVDKVPRATTGELNEKTLIQHFICASTLSSTPPMTESPQMMW